MFKSTISFIFWDIIKSSHASFPKDLGPLLRVWEHDIRGIATSMLLWKNWSISSILEAGCWKTHSGFVDQYLWDIQRQEGDVSALDPVVAVGDSVA